MSGPNPPGADSPGPDQPEREGGRHSAPEEPTEQVGSGPDLAAGSGDSAPPTGQTDLHSQAYSAPEAEHFTSGPYVPADAALYDYDSYEAAPAAVVDDVAPPRWPWVVGVTAIIAAVALVVSVALLVTSTDSDQLANPDTTTSSAPPVQDEITPTTTPPPPPPTTTTPAGPRQVTYTVTGTKAPGDIITVTYVDAAGRSRTQRNVYIPWSLTVTPISASEVGSVQASSLFLVSRLNCSITSSDGTVLSSNTANTPQTSC
ncbi:hypothetical protein A5757_13710 [Mycobacterium sp. 852013-51886_SCH5428379]|uniref:MmpS family transport accessory protein n=1 Tax=Mycobacterium sp. 852013-51886_SCH5428379 TaxID=1834111 RepID=UPI0007FB7667|nr:MmpS family transport accessory protein [Mycobacterium sp. 852013-51886_SCH5428379]OBB59384.1 hypothetical protein A5757_13710 [Mycobacterium sp. 852013-51886_SCH5428379]